MQRIGGILVSTIDKQQFYTFNSVNNLIKKTGVKEDLRYILAILNSSLMQYYYTSRFTNQSSLTVNISKTFLDQLPIVRINFSDPAQFSTYMRIVSLVNQLIDSKHNEDGGATPATIEQNRLKIIWLYKEIDKEIFTVYKFSNSEISKLMAMGQQK